MLLISEKIFFAAAGVCLFLALLAVSVFSVCFDASFYNKTFVKYNVSAQAGVSYGDLETVTDNIIKYLSGQSSALDAKVYINGVLRPFFNEKEAAHMEDVRGVVWGGFTLFAASALTLCAATAFAAAKKTLPGALHVLTVSALCCLGLFAVLCAVIAANFDGAFALFHKIFFNNDLWLLDPETDALINIMPLEFFIDAAARAGITFFMLYAVALSLLSAKTARRWVK